MGKQRIKEKNGMIWLSNELGRFERFSQEEWKIIINQSIAGLVPVLLEQSSKKIVLSVDLTYYVSLSTYEQKPMEMRSILAFIWSTVRIARNCERHGLRLESLCWDPGLVFVDQQRGRIRMIYWPVISLETSSSDPLSFYLGFLRLMKENNMLQPIYDRYKAYFYQRTSFDLNFFYQEMSAIMEYWESYEQKRQRDKKKIERKKALPLSSSEEPDYLAWLESKQGQERICIKDERTCFGRDQTLCDVKIQNDESVSRRHAVIYHVQEQFYLEDLNSKNGTYLEGKRLGSGERKELTDGAQIQFADSTFTFRIVRTNRTVPIHQRARRTI